MDYKKLQNKVITEYFKNLQPTWFICHVSDEYKLISEGHAIYKIPLKYWVLDNRLFKVNKSLENMWLKNTYLNNKIEPIGTLYYNKPCYKVNNINLIDTKLMYLNKYDYENMYFNQVEKNYPVAVYIREEMEMLILPIKIKETNTNV